MYDHLGFAVADHAASHAFYAAALAPLGIGVVGSGEGWSTFGRDGQVQLWIGAYGPPPGRVHIAFSAMTRADVDAFHRAALAAGAVDNGAPGPRPEYGPTYYAAFAIDPNGHNIEAVCRAPA